MITLMFTKSSSIGSVLIRWISRSPVSHSVIGGLELCGVPVVIHASFGGVQISTMDEFLRHHTLVAEFALMPDVSQELQSAVRKIGQRYNYVGLFGYIPVLLGRWLKKKWSNPFRSAISTVCSEFIDSVLDDGKIPEMKDLVPSETTPNDLLDVCRANTGGSFAQIFPA